MYWSINIYVDFGTIQIYRSMYSRLIESVQFALNFSSEMSWNLIVNHLEHLKLNLLIYQSIVIAHRLRIFGDYKINKNDLEEIQREKFEFSHEKGWNVS